MKPDRYWIAPDDGRLNGPRVYRSGDRWTIEVKWQEADGSGDTTQYWYNRRSKTWARILGRVFYWLGEPGRVK